MDITSLFKMSYGMYVLTTTEEDKPYGCIINTAFQITAEPAKIAVSCSKDNYTFERLLESKKFGLSVICEDTPQEIISVFGYSSGKDTDKFKDFNYILGENLSVPLLPEYTIATIECRIVDFLDVGTHTIFIGKVEDCKNTIVKSNQMTYQYFHQVRKGAAPKNAPTYVENRSADLKELWECSLCKYHYDGDTPFEDLPDTWVCPVCGAEKSLFEKKS